eukprot:scaffold618_cov130-Cylindrotheca_fusiformis.AAC.8
MKIHSQLLALLCVSGASAFRVLKSRRVGTTMGASSSYLGGLRASASGGDTAYPSGTTAPPPMDMAPPGPRRTGLSRPPPPELPSEIQGESLKTWSFPSQITERVRVSMSTEGRPLNAEIDLWQGPDNEPQKLRVYVEDGKSREFSCVVETPRAPNTVCVRNTAHMEFPLLASVEPLGPSFQPDFADGVARTVQGGALRTYAFEPDVVSVQVLLQTDGRPLNSRIELLQGPNNIKQVMEVYTEDGLERPFFTLIDTPGAGNVVRVVNTATMEFPLTAMVEPFEIDPDQM